MSKKRHQYSSPLLIALACALLIGLLAFPVSAASEVNALYSTDAATGKTRVTAEIPSGSSAEEIDINVSGFIDKFTVAGRLYPGLVETGTLTIGNKSGYAYSVTGVTFTVSAGGFGRGLNQAELAEKLSEAMNAAQPEQDSDYSVFRQSNGLGSAEREIVNYDVNRAFALGNSAELESLACKLLWNKGLSLSFDTETYPLLPSGNSADKSIQSYVDETVANLPLRKAIQKTVAANGQQEFSIGYACDADYFLSAFQGSDITVDFTIHLARLNSASPSPSVSPTQDPNTVKATLEVNKKFNGQTPPPSAFRFELSRDGSVLHTSANDKNGDAAFEISFDTVGTYSYKMTEKNAGIPVIEYDGSVYEAVVDVTREDGSLEATVIYYLLDSSGDRAEPVLIPLFENASDAVTSSDRDKEYEEKDGDTLLGKWVVNEAGNEWTFIAEETIPTASPSPSASASPSPSASATAKPSNSASPSPSASKSPATGDVMANYLVVLIVIMAVSLAGIVLMVVSWKKRSK